MSNHQLIPNRTVTVFRTDEHACKDRRHKTHERRKIKKASVKRKAPLASEAAFDALYTP